MLTCVQYLNRFTKVRQTARATLEAAYKRRNSLVHQGETKTEVDIEGQGRTSANEVARGTAKITALVTKRIIMRGGLPEWNQFELSSESARQGSR